MQFLHPLIGIPICHVGGDFEEERNELHAMIGQLLIEKDFLLKKSKQFGL